MIIFFEKSTGKIKGTIEGRIHSDQDMNMWIGDKDKTDRIVVNWKKDKSRYIPSLKDNGQKKIFEEIDKDTSLVYKFKVNTKTKKMMKL